LNSNNFYLKQGFSLIELMVTMSLSTVMFIGFMLLGIGVWDQLSFEDVHDQVETYGNYVLDDISDAFRESNIDKIDLDNSFDTSIIRVKFNDRPNIKYKVQELGGPLLAGNIATNVRNKIIFKDIGTGSFPMMNNYFQFENKGYAVTISEFNCSPYAYEPKYGASAGSNLRNALYIINMQIEIHKKSGSQLKLYDVVDFQKTIFVIDEFI